MQLPFYIREQTEKLASYYKPTQLKQASAALTEAYLNNKNDGTRLVTSDIQATVYSIVRMPSTFCAVYSSLQATTEEKGAFETMLDAGAGTGAAFFAAYELFGIKSATLVEREKSMLSIAEKICKAGGFSPELVRSDLSNFFPAKKFDLVTASYATNEMDRHSREKLLDKLLSCTKKLLLIVEPGTPEAFSLQKEIRYYLEEKGARLIAPCPQYEKCPLPSNDWCHFSCRVERSRLHKFVKDVDSPFEDEKYTYSAFCTDGSLNACNARILRHPITEKGKITLSLCNGKEVFQRTLRKGDDGYKQARKLSAGDSSESCFD